MLVRSGDRFFYSILRSIYFDLLSASNTKIAVVDGGLILQIQFSHFTGIFAKIEKTDEILYFSMLEMISMERALNFGPNHLFKKEIFRNFIFVIASYVPKFCHKNDSQNPIEAMQTS